MSARKHFHPTNVVSEASGITSRLFGTNVGIIRALIEGITNFGPKSFSPNWQQALCPKRAASYRHF